MHFLVDECTGPKVGHWLKGKGHDVFSVFEEKPEITDEAVLRKAFNEKRILVTNDKDFGERVFRRKESHHGVVLLRLEDERSKNKIAVLRKLLVKYETQLIQRFVVTTENQVRFGKI